MVRDSKAETLIEYRVEPVVLAQVCQDVLKQIGSVKTISRETGTISGHVGRLMGWSGRGNILLRITKKGDLTELHIQTSHTEGLLTLGQLAATDLATFTKALGQDQRLAGKSTGGWEESSPTQETPTKRVGFLLGLGILFIPYIFSWLTLGKGYSSRARFVAIGWMIIAIFWGLQDRKTNSGSSTFTQSSSRQESADSSPATKSTMTQQGSDGMASTLIEKRKKLLKRCQEAIKTISKMQLQQQKQMAALASEADEGLIASGRILSGTIKVPNPNAPNLMLDDVEFFVDEITHCSESAKQRKPCSLSADARAVLRSYTESSKTRALRSLSTFCNE